MTKTEAKAIAKKEMLTAIGVAYYRICDGNEYSEAEKELIIEYMNKYGATMAKAIKGEYVTY